jgi:erythromycin esterase-like protein
MFQVQADAARRMIECHNTRKIIMELPLVAAHSMNNAVLRARENGVADKIEGFGWTTWANSEIRGLLEFAWAWNQAHRDKVTICGVDFQTAAQHFLLRNRRVPIADHLETDVDGWCTEFGAVWGGKNGPSTKEDVAVATGLAARAYALFEGLRESGSPDAADLLLNATQLLRFRVVRLRAEIDRTPDLSWTLRDLYMAANTLRCVEQLPPGQPAVLLAHNAHISTDPTAERRPIGYHLRLWFGSPYRAIAQSTGGGSFASTSLEPGDPVREFMHDQPPEGSIESVLVPMTAKENSQGGALYVDLRGAFAVPEVRQWWSTPLRFRQIGWRVLKNEFTQVVLPECFDDLVFHNRSEGSHLFR